MTDDTKAIASAVLEAIAPDLDRLTRAILGDPEVGHQGAIERLNRIDDLHLRIPEEHSELEKRRIEGDRRAHDRIDEKADKAEVETLAVEVRATGRKVDRLVWVFIGAGLAAGGGVAAIFQAAGAG